MMITLKKFHVPILSLLLIVIVTPVQAANGDLCTAIMAITKPKASYESPAERIATDLNNIGKIDVIDNVFVADEIYIKINSQAWKKAKIAQVSQTRDHVTDSFGRHSKCEDVGNDESYIQPTHRYRVVVFNDRNKPGVEIFLTTDSKTGEPLREDVEWTIPEPRFQMAGEPIRSTIRWTYTGIVIPVAETDITPAIEERTKRQSP